MVTYKVVEMLPRIHGNPRKWKVQRVLVSKFKYIMPEDIVLNIPSKEEAQGIARDYEDGK